MTEIRRTFDVDIDVKSNMDKSDFGTRGMVYNEDTAKIIPHPSAFFLEFVPVDPLTGNAAIDHKYAEAQGFMKVDLLSNTTYDSFRSKKEVLMSLEKEPDWSMLEDREFVETLPHLGKHFEIVQRLEPRSIEDIADVLALIRPGKTHLIDAYQRNKADVRVNLYKRPNDGQMYFKKSHAISYAAMIVCTMNRKTGRNIILW